MALSENPLASCLAAVTDAGLGRELERLCSTAGLAFASFPGADLVLEQLDRRDVDLVILDMEALNGGRPRDLGRSADRGLTGFVSEARRIRPGLPILVLLPPAPDEELMGLACEAGVTDFLSQPLSRLEFTVRVRAAAETALTHRRWRHSFQTHEDEIRRAIGEIMLREAETLSVLGKAAEYKDRETSLHIARVAHYSQLIARMIGTPAADQDALFNASALHDIGKLGIPDAVLLKPGRLNAGEFAVMQTHTMIGYNILKDSRSQHLLTGAMIALTHHEKYDGTGYPMRLKGEEIPLFGRIVGIADVFDALTTKRPYKEVWPLERAFAHLAQERGRHFDPTLIYAFLSNSLGVEWIYHNHADVKALNSG
jgi:response regulator RpfG family c-di-GMP phosphodiesterase